jgi:hypothetical protein
VSVLIFSPRKFLENNPKEIALSIESAIEGSLVYWIFDEGVVNQKKTIKNVLQLAESLCGIKTKRQG